MLLLVVLSDLIQMKLFSLPPPLCKLSTLGETGEISFINICRERSRRNWWHQLISLQLKALFHSVALTCRGRCQTSCIKLLPRRNIKRLRVAVLPWMFVSVSKIKSNVIPQAVIGGQSYHDSWARFGGSSVKSRGKKKGIFPHESRFAVTGWWSCAFKSSLVSYFWFVQWFKLWCSALWLLFLLAGETADLTEYSS